LEVKKQGAAGFAKVPSSSLPSFMKFNAKDLKLELRPRLDNDKGSLLMGVEVSDGYSVPNMYRFKISVVEPLKPNST
jgi:hypothetical protein